MSKLHVTQIEGYLTSKLTGSINMEDYASHSDLGQVKKAFLTRGLAVLAASHTTDVPLNELCGGVTDGS
jgi:hypothetical protein